MGYPAARMSWLSPATQAVSLRWPLTPLQTRIAAVGLAALFVIVLLMVFPVLPRNGPAWIIYRFHDTVVLPFQGRLFQRYAPLPQIMLAVLLGMAIAAVFLRHRAVEVYDAVLGVMLRSALARRVLAAWAARFPKDAPLLSALEVHFRRAFARALILRRPEDLAATRLAGDFLFSLEIDTGVRGHLGRAGLAAREEVLAHVLDRPLRDSAPAGLGRFEQPLSIIGDPTTSVDLRAEVIDGLWSEIDMLPAHDRVVGLDALLWMAVLGGLREDDAALPRSVQQRIASRQTADLLAGEPNASLLFDPLVWSVDPGLARGQSFPGMALTGQDVGLLAQEIIAAEREARDEAQP